MGSLHLRIHACLNNLDNFHAFVQNDGNVDTRQTSMTQEHVTNQQSRLIDTTLVTIFKTLYSKRDWLLILLPNHLKDSILNLNISCLIYFLSTFLKNTTNDVLSKLEYNSLSYPFSIKHKSISYLIILLNTYLVNSFQIIGS